MVFLWNLHEGQPFMSLCLHAMSTRSLQGNDLKTSEIYMKGNHSCLCACMLCLQGHSKAMIFLWKSMQGNYSCLCAGILKVTQRAKVHDNSLIAHGHLYKPHARLSNHDRHMLRTMCSLLGISRGSSACIAPCLGTCQATIFVSVLAYFGQAQLAFSRQEWDLWKLGLAHLACSWQFRWPKTQQLSHARCF